MKTNYKCKTTRRSKRERKRDANTHLTTRKTTHKQTVVNVEDTLLQNIATTTAEKKVICFWFICFKLKLPTKTSVISLFV